LNTMYSRTTSCGLLSEGMRLSHQLTGRARSHRQSGSRSGFATPRPAPRWRRWPRIVRAQVTLPPCVRPPRCGGRKLAPPVFQPELAWRSACACGHGGVPKLRPSRARTTTSRPTATRAPATCRGSRIPRQPLPIA
jgi:hypothetical protein